MADTYDLQYENVGVAASCIKRARNWARRKSPEWVSPLLDKAVDHGQNLGKSYRWPNELYRPSVDVVGTKLRDIVDRVELSEDGLLAVHIGLHAGALHSFLNESGSDWLLHFSIMYNGEQECAGWGSAWKKHYLDVWNHDRNLVRTIPRTDRIYVPNPWIERQDLN